MDIGHQDIVADFTKLKNNYERTNEHIKWIKISDWLRGTIECYPYTIFVPIRKLLKDLYKFFPRIQPSLSDSTNNNFGEYP